MNMSVVLVLAAALLLGAALAARKFAPSMARLPMWLGSAALGAAAGVGVTMACVSMLGYVKLSDLREGARPPSASGMGMPGGGGMGAGGIGGGMPGGGMPGGGMGGAMPGGGMGGSGIPGGMGMSDGVFSAQRLTALIAKLNLLSPGVHLELSVDQQRELVKLLADIEARSQLPAAEIDATVAAIERLLSAEQLAVLDSVDLPRLAPFGGHRPGGPTGPALGAGPSSTPPGREAPDVKNPFLLEVNAARLNQLRQYLAQAGAPDEPGGAVDETAAEVIADLPIREDLLPSPPPANPPDAATAN